MSSIRREIVDRVANIQNKNVLTLIYSFLSDEGKSSNFTSNQNGIFFNLSKMNDDTMTKLIEILNKTDKYMAEYGQIETQRQELMSTLKKEKNEDEECKQKSPSLPSVSPLVPSPQKSEKKKKNNNNNVAIEPDDYDSLMKMHLKKPVYKGACGRIDKILRKRKSNSSSRSNNIRRIMSRSSHNDETEEDQADDEVEVEGDDLEEEVEVDDLEIIQEEVEGDDDEDDPIELEQEEDEMSENEQSEENEEEGDSSNEEYKYQLEIEDDFV